MVYDLKAQIAQIENAAENLERASQARESKGQILRDKFAAKRRLSKPKSADPYEDADWLEEAREAMKETCCEVKANPILQAKIRELLKGKRRSPAK